MPTKNRPIRRRKRGYIPTMDQSDGRPGRPRGGTGNNLKPNQSRRLVAAVGGVYQVLSRAGGL
eukprot:9501128-Pyramimonas_sp.AAC.1